MADTASQGVLALSLEDENKASLSVTADILGRKVLEHAGYPNKQAEATCRSVARMFGECTPEWLCPTHHQHGDTALTVIADIYSHQLIARIAQWMQLEQHGDGDAGYPKQKLENAIRRGQLGLEVLTQFLRALHRHRASLDRAVLRRGLRDAAGPLLLACALHSPTPTPWTTPQLTTTSQKLLDLVLKLCGVDSIHELLGGSNSQKSVLQSGGCFSSVLSLFRPRLSRDTWKQEPATRSAFLWCLQYLKHPNLGQYLDQVLPPALLFIDDYKVSNKLLGINCLKHTIDNVDPTELRWRDRAHVVYQALFQQTYIQDVQLVGALYPCLLAILKVVNKPHLRPPDKPQKENRYDKVFQQLLQNMDFEQKILLRRELAGQLPSFIDSMGITVVRHLKGLLRVVFQYLEVYDGPQEVARLHTLLALQSLITQTWPRMPYHCAAIMESLFKLLVDLSTDTTLTPATVKRELVEATVECLLLLKRCCGGQVEEILHTLTDIPSLASPVNRVLQENVNQAGKIS